MGNDHLPYSMKITKLKHCKVRRSTCRPYDMATTMVRVRPLSGNCLYIVMKPDMTLAELRARIEEALPVVPHFHDVKVFEGLSGGLRELTDNDAIVDPVLSELFTYVAISPAKAIAKLVQVGQGDKDVWDNTKEIRLVYDAAAILGKTEGLSDFECDVIVTTSNFIRFEVGLRLRRDMHELALAILENLGRSLAASNNTTKYRDALLDESSDISVVDLDPQLNGQFYFAEMVARHGVEWIPDKSHAAILSSHLLCVKVAIDRLQLPVDRRSNWCYDHVLQIFVSPRIAGFLGNSFRESLLLHFLDVFTANDFFIPLQTCQGCCKRCR